MTIDIHKFGISLPQPSLLNNIIIVGLFYPHTNIVADPVYKKQI